MPLFGHNDKNLEEPTPLYKDLDKVEAFRIDYIQIMKKKLPQDKYIEYLEKELSLALSALQRSVRFATALDVAKAENQKNNR